MGYGSRRYRIIPKKKQKVHVQTIRLILGNYNNEKYNKLVSNDLKFKTKLHQPFEIWSRIVVDVTVPNKKQK